MNAAAARVPVSADPTPDPALVTDSSVTGVMIQFFSGNRTLFPSRFNRLHEVRSSHRNSTSTEIIPSATNVAVGSIFDDLAKAGFVLVDGFCYERASPENSEFGKALHVMRFQFYPARTYRFESEGKKVYAEGELKLFFGYLTGNAHWDVAVYNNVMSSGGNAIGIKCSSRFAITNPDGTPLTRKPRNERGKPYGEPQPFVPAPQAQLCIVDGRLVLV